MSSPWTTPNKEVPDRGSQLDYSVGFVFFGYKFFVCFFVCFVCFFFRSGHVLARATRQDIGHGRAARPAPWSWAGPELMRAVGPAPGRTAR
jgi:hypothetical protein